MTPWRITDLADVEYYDSRYYDSMVVVLQDSRVILLRGDTTCSAYNLAHEPPLPLLSLLPLLTSAGRRRQNRDSTSRPRLSAKSASSITSTTSSPPPHSPSPIHLVRNSVSREKGSNNVLLDIIQSDKRRTALSSPWGSLFLFIGASSTGASSPPFDLSLSSQYYSDIHISVRALSLSQ